MGKNTELGMFVHRKQGLFLSENMDDIEMAGKNQNLAPMWKKLMKKTSILTNQHHFLTTCIWDALNVNANQMRPSLNSTQKCLSHVFLLEQLNNYRGGNPTTWKDMRKHALSDSGN